MKILRWLFGGGVPKKIEPVDVDVVLEDCVAHLVLGHRIIVKEFKAVTRPDRYYRGGFQLTSGEAGFAQFMYSFHGRGYELFDDEVIPFHAFRGANLVITKRQETIKALPQYFEERLKSH